jgi:predicted permease
LKFLGTVNPGFDVAHGVTAHVELDSNRFTTADRALLAERLRARLEGSAGIASVSYTSLLPLEGNSSDVRGRLVRERPDWIGPEVRLANVGPNYFATMAIAVRRGREFTPVDRHGAPEVAIVNDTFVRLAFPDGEALGKHVRTSEDAPWAEIVGVVADAKYGFLHEAPTPQLFRPFLQRGGRLIVQARVAGAPERYLAGIRRAVAEIDPTLMVTVQTTAEATSQELTVRRFATILLAGLGMLGLALTLAGLVGVLAWDVARRTREIGIRIALGASRGHVRAAVVRDALRLVGIGTVLGLAGASLVAMPVRVVLPGVAAVDPATVVVVSLLLVGFGILASWIPARRASAVDPVIALRSE